MRREGPPRRRFFSMFASKLKNTPRLRVRRRPFFLQRQLWCEDGARENQLLLLPDGVGLFDGRVFEEKKGERNFR